MMTVAKRDRLHYFAPEPVLMNRAIQPAYQRTIAFETVEQVNAWGIDETVDFVSWRSVVTETPHLWIGVGPKRATFGSMEANAFYRAWVRFE